MSSHSSMEQNLMTIPIGSIREGSNHTQVSTVCLSMAGDWLLERDEASLFSDIAQENDEFAFERLEESPSSEEFSIQDVNSNEEDDDDDALMDLLLQQVDQEPEPFFPSSTPAPSNSVPSAIQWGEHDVPLGRCQEVREHVGNIRYRELVEQHRPAYQKTTRKSDKTVISTMIYNTIRMNGGRFLDRVKKPKNGDFRQMVTTNEWYEIPQDKAIAKIAQSLRNGTRPVKKEKPLLMKNHSNNSHSRVASPVPAVAAAPRNNAANTTLPYAMPHGYYPASKPPSMSGYHPYPHHAPAWYPHPHPSMPHHAPFSR